MPDTNWDALGPVVGGDSEADQRQAAFQRNKAWVRPGVTTYQTKLNDNDEKAFQAWVRANKVPFEDVPDADYDMRGFWKASQDKDQWERLKGEGAIPPDLEPAGTKIDPNDGLPHFPDYWKTPYHETFSDESQFALHGAAPRWNDKDQLIAADGTIMFDDRAPKQATTSGDWDSLGPVVGQTNNQAGGPIMSADTQRRADAAGNIMGRIGAAFTNPPSPETQRAMEYDKANLGPIVGPWLAGVNQRVDRAGQVLGAVGGGVADLAYQFLIDKGISPDLARDIIAAPGAFAGMPGFFETPTPREGPPRLEIRPEPRGLGGPETGGGPAPDGGPPPSGGPGAGFSSPETPASAGEPAGGPPTPSGKPRVEPRVTPPTAAEPTPEAAPEITPEPTSSAQPTTQPEVVPKRNLRAKSTETAQSGDSVTFYAPDRGDYATGTLVGTRKDGRHVIDLGAGPYVIVPPNAVVSVRGEPVGGEGAESEEQPPSATGRPAAEDKADQGKPSRPRGQAWLPAPPVTPASTDERQDKTASDDTSQAKTETKAPEGMPPVGDTVLLRHGGTADPTPHKITGYHEFAPGEWTFTAEDEAGNSVTDGINALARDTGRTTDLSNAPNGPWEPQGKNEAGQTVYRNPNGLHAVNEDGVPYVEASRDGKPVASEEDRKPQFKVVEPLPEQPVATAKAKSPDESWVRDAGDVTDAIARNPLPEGWELGVDPANPSGYAAFDNNDKIVGRGATLPDALRAARAAAKPKAETAEPESAEDRPQWLVDQFPAYAALETARRAFDAHDPTYQKINAAHRRGEVSESEYQEAKRKRDELNSELRQAEAAAKAEWDWSTAKVGDILPRNGWVIVGKKMDRKHVAEELAKQTGGYVTGDGKRDWAVIAPPGTTPPSTEKEAAASEAPEQTDSAQPEIVEHVVQKTGKVLRGIIRTDLTKDQAKALDRWTFKKGNGWFIRVGNSVDNQAGEKPAAVEPEFQPNKAQADALRKARDFIKYGDPLRRLYFHPNMVETFIKNGVMEDDRTQSDGLKLTDLGRRLAGIESARKPETPVAAEPKAQEPKPADAPVLEGEILPPTPQPTQDLSEKIKNSWVEGPHQSKMLAQEAEENQAQNDALLKIKAAEWNKETANWRPIGWNEDSYPLYQDDAGIRFYDVMGAHYVEPFNVDDQGYIIAPYRGPGGGRQRQWWVRSWETPNVSPPGEPYADAWEGMSVENREAAATKARVRIDPKNKYWFNLSPDVQAKLKKVVTPLPMPDIKRGQLVTSIQGTGIFPPVTGYIQAIKPSNGGWVINVRGQWYDAKDFDRYRYVTADERSPRPALQAIPPAIQAIPSLGNTAQEVWNAWRDMKPPGGSYQVVGKMIAGGEYFFRDGKLYRSFPRTAKTLATYRDATPAEQDEVFDAIEAGAMQIVAQPPQGLSEPGRTRDLPVTVFHQATGTPFPGTKAEARLNELLKERGLPPAIQAMADKHDIPTEGRTPAEVADAIVQALTPEQVQFESDKLEQQRQAEYKAAEAAAINWIVYHGTPHLFERFDLAHVGNGEGAQAYGHGLYFAENEGVARGYRDALSPKGRIVDPDGVEQASVGHDGEYYSPYGYFTSGDSEKAQIGRAFGWFMRAKGDYEAAKRDAPRTIHPVLNRMQELGMRYEQPKSGNLYTVRIKAKPEEMLDWDKPVGEQSDYIKSALRKTNWAPDEEVWPHYTGEQLYTGEMQADGPYKDSGWASSKARESVSAKMRKAGIKGIRYLDAGSRSDGEGTRNVVIFDDKDVEITHRNGEPLTRQEKIYGQPQNRPLEDLEHEQEQQAENATAAQQRAGSDEQPRSAAENQGPVPQSVSEGGGNLSPGGGDEAQTENGPAVATSRVAPQSVEAASSKPLDDRAYEAEWLNLTKTGREDVFTKAGVRLPYQVLWHNISPENKAKLRPYLEAIPQPFEIGDTIIPKQGSGLDPKPRVVQQIHPGGIGWSVQIGGINLFASDFVKAPPAETSSVKPDPYAQFPNHLKRPDGRLIPQVGDQVFQTVAGPFGTPASIQGEVYGSSTKPRVRVTGSFSVVGAAQTGRTYPLDGNWTVVGDPELQRRQDAEAKVQADRKARIEAEFAAENDKKETAAAERGTLDAAAVDIGAVIEGPDGELAVIGDKDERGTLFKSDFDEPNDAARSFDPRGWRVVDVPPKEGMLVRDSDRQRDDGGWPANKQWLNGQWVPVNWDDQKRDYVPAVAPEANPTQQRPSDDEIIRQVVEKAKAEGQQAGSNFFQTLTHGMKPYERAPLALQASKAVQEALAAGNLYRPTLRPASGGGVPPGVKWDYVEAPAMAGLANRPDLPQSKHRYGVIRTDRALTPGEISHFDLEPVGPDGNLQSQPNNTISEGSEATGDRQTDQPVSSALGQAGGSGSGSSRNGARKPARNQNPTALEEQQAENAGSTSSGGRSRKDGDGSGREEVASPTTGDQVGNAGDGRRGTGDKGVAASGTGGREEPRPTPSRPNFWIDDPESLVGGTPKVRFQRNRQAIEALENITSENRAPTDDELKAMAGYIGWGSFGQDLFQGTYEYPHNRPGWNDEAKWLREQLGQEAWESAQRSIINAHYTDPPTVQAMWDMVRQMGFKGGRILEPSMGVGNFFGMMPRDIMANSDLTGIELDNTTGRMAQLLYPQAGVHIKGYEQSRTPDNFYDLVIGNWPFANIVPSDRRYNALNLSLHNYFFVKALDQTRPGGLVVGITSSFTMDSQARAARMEMAKRGELVAAFRLPSGAFEQYAGTKVVTDIIILRKRERPLMDASQEAWVNLAKVNTPAGREIDVNQYYANHPDHVLGTLNYGSGTTFGQAGMIVDRPDDLMQRLQETPATLPEDAYKPKVRGAEPRFVVNNSADRHGSVTIGDDGNLYQVQGERLVRLQDIAKSLNTGTPAAQKKRDDQVRRLISLRKAYGALIDAERDGLPNTENLRKVLRDQYEEFRRAHGPIGPSDGIRILDRVEDPSTATLQALERPDGTPARILSEPTVRARRSIKNPSIADAYILTRNESTAFDIERVAELSKRPVADVAQDLLDRKAICRTPGGGYEPADTYLSGNVRVKLAEAKEALARGEPIRESVDALTAALPKDVPYYNIEVKLGASWVGDQAYKDFIGDTLNLNAAARNAVEVSFVAGRWKVRFGDRSINYVEAARNLATPDVDFEEMINHAMKNTVAVVKRRDVDGNQWVDEKASTEANNKIQALKDRFPEWVWADPERKILFERAYNETMNAIAKPRFDGSFMDMSGMALRRGDDPFSLRRHQVNAIWRGVAQGRGLFAHEVGTGKTYTMAGIAVEGRRYGVHKKPLIFAHNANSAAVAKEIGDMYPGAQILYIDNLSPDTINVKLNQIANEDWDAIVMPHSLIDRMALSEETLMAMAADEIAALEAEALSAASEDGQNLTVEMMDDKEAMKRVRSPTAKQLVKQRETIKNNIRKSAEKSSKEGAVPFEKLGVDAIIVDEAHEFKKRPVSTRMRLKGLNTDTSNRAIGLMFLTNYVKANREGKGVYLFTGTPITNTLNEIYNQSKFFMDDRLAAAGVNDWDTWFGTFSDGRSDVELNAAGGYEPVTRLAAFVNVDELVRMMSEFTDVVKASDMPEFLPRSTPNGKTIASEDLTPDERDYLENGRTDNPIGRPYKKIVNDIGEMGPEQREVLAYLQRLSYEFKAASRKQRRDWMLAGDEHSPILIEGNAAKASLDVRQYNPAAEDFEDSKINRVVRNVLEIYKTPNAAQAIFMDNGYTVSKANRGAGRDFVLVDDLINKLVKGGIPRNEIAVIAGGTDPLKKKAIADGMNNGQYRVVIGQSSTAGVGVNMQTNLRAMHHVDAPWRPGDLEQRNGRGERQGNKWNTVLEYRYIVEGIDGRRWQVLAVKDRFIKEFISAFNDESGKRIGTIEGDAADIGDENLLETLGAAAGDPRLLLKAKFKSDVERLERRERTHTGQQVQARERARQLAAQAAEDASRAAVLENQAAQWRASVERSQQAAATAGDTRRWYEAEIGGIKYNLGADIDEAISRAVPTVQRGQQKVIGTVGGFEIVVDWSNRWNSAPYYEIYGPNDVSLARIEGPTIRRISNALNRFDTDAQALRSQVRTKLDAIPGLEEAGRANFPQMERLLKARQKMIDLEEDLQKNPQAPPPWLRYGAPMDSEFYIKTFTTKLVAYPSGGWLGLNLRAVPKTEARVVTGHRVSDDYYVLTEEGEVHYMDAKDASGQNIYEEHDKPERIDAASQEWLKPYTDKLDSELIWSDGDFALIYGPDPVVLGEKTYLAFKKGAPEVDQGFAVFGRRPASWDRDGNMQRSMQERAETDRSRRGD